MTRVIAHGATGTFAISAHEGTLAHMPCLHPQEERQPVYQGAATPRPGRSFCSLCGAVLYEPLTAAAPEHRAGAPLMRAG